MIPIMYLSSFPDLQFIFFTPNTGHNSLHKTASDLQQTINLDIYIELYLQLPNDFQLVVWELLLDEVCCGAACFRSRVGCRGVESRRNKSYTLLQV